MQDPEEIEILWTALHSDAKQPTRGSEEAGWFDVYVVVDEAESDSGLTKVRTLRSGQRATLRTGVASAIPKGWRAKFEERSGLAAKKGIQILGGCLDSDYRSEWKVIILNSGPESYEIANGDRVMQVKFERVPEVRFKQVTIEELPQTTRGAGGFGSTGR
jgi:dUTP pyrophosphatase